MPTRIVREMKGTSERQKISQGLREVGHLDGLDDNKFSQLGRLCRSSLGKILEALAGLVERKCHGVKEDPRWNTPLARAARNRHDAGVRTQLRPEGVDPDKPDNGGQTPLLYPALTPRAARGPSRQARY